MQNYKLRLVPLGGVVGVTKNMYLYEIYEDEKLKDILIVDCGIGFPREKELGVDFVIPDISYLKDKTDKIRAILLTHGHEDHHSALPFHYKELGMPPIFTAKLTASFVENKFKEHNLRPNLTIIKFDEVYTFGDFKAEFIHITHSIPDTLHMVIKTPVGNFYHGADFKIDVTPAYGAAPDFYKITKAGKDGVLCLLSDCLGAEREGMTLSENVIGQTFEDEMRKTKGKFFMTTFSSNISRIRQCVEAAIKFNRKIVFMGRSMRDNTLIASDIGYLPIPYEFLAKEEQISKLPPNKLCLIAAGSQGQYDSALSKIATNRNRFLKIKAGDKVVFSSDPIPGNENEINALIEALSRMGADVVYSDIRDQLHASGHGNQEDLKLLMRFTNPTYFIPIGGEGRHQRAYQRLATELGFKKDNVFLLEEGQTVWFTPDRKARAGETVETKNVYVDAYGVGDVGNVVLRDRQTLSSEGVVVALLILDNKGQLVERPRLLSKGFVFEPREQELFKKAQSEIERLVKPQQAPPNINTIRKEINAQLENLFFKSRGRKPLIIVDIVQI